MKHSTLYNEIEEALKTQHLPSHLAGELHDIRQIGNDAAHPMRSEHTGEVFNVEPEEAEWMLDVLEGLLDFYFVQPEVSRRRKAAREAKRQPPAQGETP